MNIRQVQLVRDSFEFFRPCGPALIAQAVRSLTDDRPSLRALLPDDTTRLHKRWFETLSQIVLYADRFGRLAGPLGLAGAAAAHRGLTPAHYAVCRDQLLAAMAALAGPDWTSELSDAWSLLLDATTGAMLAGAIPLPRAA